ncbi:MAG: acylphosphatase [Candidatus Kapabacteria bacterium]|nr:acylphosphatase [Candidatus Kapabacteria bacterium]MCS7169348.1 acylphosphatase [Candidatus Kapabacteria bacterium]MDW7997448.1 acylphosphatase [Bacteroidota bacterium]MDW8224564.1 acylphosphatase [Bacteroidota bacterium]
MQSRAHIRAKGIVQGVGFRYFVLHYARQLGLRGFVRNCSGNEVETVVEGDREAIERLIGLIRLGPPAACVEEVQVQWGTPTQEFTNFEIRRSL